MPPDVYKVTSNVHAAFVLYCMVLLGWSDLDYATGVLFGFPLSGCLGRPNSFRTSPPQTNLRSRADLLFRQHRVHRFPGKSPLELRRTPTRTQPFKPRPRRASTSSPPVLCPRTQMDTIYRRGSWRPMRRFVIWQGHHKNGVASTTAMSPDTASTLCPTLSGSKLPSSPGQQLWPATSG